MSDPEVEVDYTAIATSILRRITGGRWTWPPMEVRDVYTIPAGVQRIQLRGEPLINVVAVRDYRTGLAIPYDRMGSSRIELLSGRCGPDRRVDVTYRYGAKPSALLARAISVLADEMEKADDNDNECRLPERVTTVNRQGVSWTLIDPMDFIDKGRTGLIEVDMAINAIGTPKARPRVFSPEYPPPDRMYARVVDLADSYDLALAQGLRKRVGFKLRFDGTAQNLTDYQRASKIRAAEDPTSALLLDLSPYLALDPGDNTQLWLDIPAGVTAALDPADFAGSARWDLVVWPTGHAEDRVVLTQGDVTLDPTTSV